jgi:hypothetical protein
MNIHPSLMNLDFSIMYHRYEPMVCDIGPYYRFPFNYHCWYAIDDDNRIIGLVTVG